MSETGERRENVRSLKEAIRRVRTAEAERSDVVVELRDAERARLEILAEELKGVFAEVPAEDEQFLFTVATGLPPRLWIDMTSFVVMGRDRRTYRFLKDTRLGRTVIVESADIDDVADAVTTYVAERIIERDRAIEGDWVAKRAKRASEPAEAPERMRPPILSRLAGQQAIGWVAAAFLLGLLVGVVGLLAYAWVSVPIG